MTDVTMATADQKLRVLSELKRVLETSFENASDRQRALLRYLVTEELENRGGRIKAYNIATEIFGRPADFDPQQDSIVRVEVGRLRQTLERHYLTAGAEGPVVITIPKGQYRPVFVEPNLAPTRDEPPAESAAPRSEKRRLTLVVGAGLAVMAALGLAALFFGRPAERATTPATPTTAERKSPVVAIAPFEFSADRPGQDYVADGLQAEIASALAEFDWLTVVPLLESPPPQGAAPQMDFLVQSAMRLVGDRLTATVLLLDGETRGVRWSKRYEMPLAPGEVATIEHDLVARIANDVGHPFGVVGDIERSRMKNGGDQQAAFSCKLHAMRYWAERRRADYPAARACYEALPEQSRDADTLGALAMLRLDAIAEHFEKTPRAELLTSASHFAERAYDSDKMRVLAQIARYSTALCRGDAATFQTTIRSFVAEHPNNPIALSDAGLRMTLGSIDPAEGMNLLERAKALSHNLLPVAVTAPATESLRRGETPDLGPLGVAAADTDATWVLLSYLAAASAGQNEKEMARALGRLADVGYSTPAEIRAALDAQCWSKETRSLVGARIEEALHER